ncbi:MAG: flagellar protein FliS [Lachnospiraceae bacterium]|nr:flagellar protein FliS [Lachnospiraceae bacterium]
MTKELIQEYTLKITQANRSRIIVIVYDIAEQYIKDGLEAFDRGDLETFRDNCGYTLKCVGDLMEALDFSHELAYPLMRLYQFISRQISLASVKNDTEGLLTARGLLLSLRESFEEVAKQDDSGPVMGNTESVYAGLTYGRNSLNESINGSDNRGFMA